MKGLRRKEKYHKKIITKRKNIIKRKMTKRKFRKEIVTEKETYDGNIL